MIRANNRLAARYGEWAVVTGASSGVGREMARGLAASGLNVALVARTASALHQLADEIKSAHHVNALPLPQDLATGGAASVIHAMKDHNVGLLVNAAGFGSGGIFLTRNVTSELEMIDVNCRALLELTHAFATRFAGQRRGGIILMSSIVAFQGVAFSANYAATKAYVQSLGEALAEELGGCGVDVLTSAPGPTNSGFAARAGMRLGKAESAQQVAMDTIAALGRKRTVVPGLLSKLLHGSLMTTPRFVRIKIMRTIMKSMT